MQKNHAIIIGVIAVSFGILAFLAVRTRPQVPLAQQQGHALEY